MAKGSSDVWTKSCVKDARRACRRSHARRSEGFMPVCVNAKLTFIPVGWKWLTHDGAEEIHSFSSQSWAIRWMLSNQEGYWRKGSVRGRRVCFSLLFNATKIVEAESVRSILKPGTSGNCELTVRIKSSAPDFKLTRTAANWLKSKRLSPSSPVLTVTR